MFQMTVCLNPANKQVFRCSHNNLQNFWVMRMFPSAFKVSACLNVRRFTKLLNLFGDQTCCKYHN